MYCGTTIYLLYQYKNIPDRGLYAAFQIDGYDLTCAVLCPKTL